jgi:hypothetical protein
MERLDGAGRSEGRLTRRGMLIGAGSLAAVGGVRTQTAAAAPHARHLGEPRRGEAAAEAVGEVAQDGNGITGYGYLTRLAGVRDATLFTGPQRDESTARITFTAQVEVREHFAHGVLVASVGFGTLALHLAEGGSDFADPASFARGRRIASYRARLRNVATVVAPNEAVVAIEGELVQRAVRDFALGGRRSRLGRHGTRLRLHATGQGMRTQPVPPRAVFDVAGRFDLAD